MQATPSTLSPSWFAAGAASAATRFVPVPFVDDIVKERSERYVVARVLEKAGLLEHLDKVAPLYEGKSGSHGQGIVKKVVLFPLRRVLRLARAVPGVPRDIMRPPLLGRATQIAIDKGLFQDANDAREFAAVATQVRRSFEESFSGISRRLFTAAARDVRNLPRGAGDEGLSEFIEQFEARFVQKLDNDMHPGQGAPEPSASS